MKNSYRLSLLIFLAFSAFGCRSANQISLNPKENNNYNFKSKMNMQMSMKMMGMDINMSMDMNSSNGIKILKNTSSSLEVSSTVKDIDFKIKMIPDMPLPKDAKFDMSKMVLSQDLSFDKNGKILKEGEMKGLEDLKASMPQLNMGGFGNNSFSNQSLFVPIYNKDLKIGDSIIIDLANKSGDSSSQIKYSYTYLGDKDTLGFKCAKFKFKSINAATKQNINQMGMDMVVDSEMDIQGFLLLDLNDGICVNSTSKN